MTFSFLDGLIEITEYDGVIEFKFVAPMANIEGAYQIRPVPYSLMTMEILQDVESTYYAMLEIAKDDYAFSVH